MDHLIFNLNHLEIIKYILFTFLFGVSMHAWGNLLLSNSDIKYISLNIVIGMAITLFIGGILNFLSLAYKIAIDFIFIFGLFLFCVRAFRKKYYSKLLSVLYNFKKIDLIFLVPLILLIIKSITSISPEAYNFHDDYQKYFVHPVKMLEAGSLLGSKLGAIGLQTLGGQAFFQSFFISWLGIKSINIFDSVFCLIISSIIIFEYCIEKKIFFFGALVLCLFILIHPQYVNISSLYSASLFMLSSIILSLKLLNQSQKLNNFNLKTILALSLCFATLPVLKSTNGIFPVIYFFLFSIVFIFINISSKYKIFVIIGIPILSIIFFIPWTFILINFYTDVPFTTNQPLNVNLPWIKPVFSSFFSTNSLLYGGIFLQYSSIFIITLFFVLIILFNLLKNKEFNKINKRVFFASLLINSTALIIVTIIIFFGSKIQHFPTLIRYSIPFILSTIPIGLILTYALIKNKKRYYKLAIFTAVICLCVSFVPKYIDQINQSYKCGSKLSFKIMACSNKYITYNKNVLHGKRKVLTQNWQEYLPKGETIMAWINTPFFLDFKRNDIKEIVIGGFNNPWTVFPSAKFLIFEHNGYATRSLEEIVNSANNDNLISRKISIRTIQHIIKINQLIKTDKAKVIKKDNSIIILEIE